MQLLRQVIHPSLGSLEGRQFTRETGRAIVTKEEEILLLYTQRYDDYSLPGGGINEGETIKQGLKRELYEETGAKNIKVLGEFGLYEEYRPWYKDDFSVIHIKSYCYFCSIDMQLGQAQLEHYEQQNGMVAKWINIHNAIAHNERTLAHSDKQGFSILRETYLLKEIAKKL